MALQHIADCLIADLIPEVGQCSHDPVIAPIMLLLGHADDQLLDLSTDPRPSGAMAGLRAIEFAGNQLAVPDQNRIGRATVATSARALRPNQWPISASIARSASDSFSRPFNWAFKI
jgi:hypothetical protein